MYRGKPIEPTLKGKVARYINAKEDKSANFDEIADHLMKNFPLYHKIPYPDLKNQIEIAYNIYLIEHGKEILPLTDTFDMDKIRDQVRNFPKDGIRNVDAKKDDIEANYEDTKKDDIEVIETNNAESSNKKRKADGMEVDIEELSKLKKQKKKFAAEARKKYRKKVLATESSHSFYGIKHTLKNAKKSVKHLSGMDKARQFVCQLETFHIMENQKAVLISGPSGSGKNFIAETIFELLDIPFVNVNEKHFANLTSTNQALLLENLFKFCEDHQRVTGILMDSISDLENHRNTNANKVIDLSNKLLSLIEKYSGNVWVVILSEHPEIMEKGLKLCCREFAIPSLSPSDRLEILEKMLKNKKEDYIDYDENIDLKEIAFRAAAYVVQDLERLVEDAIRSAYLKEYARFVEEENIDSFEEEHLFENKLNYGFKRLTVIQDDFIETMMSFIPTLKKEGFPYIPEIKMNEVAGMEHIKGELRDKYLRPLANPKLHKLIDIKKPFGVLLYGPPGCGKSLLAKAVASEAGLNFLSVSGAEPLSMYQGETESNIRNIFEKAAKAAPCVIFFDEFDSLCQRRSKINESGSKSSISTELIARMDGMHSRRGIHIMGATNRPDVLDPAILRPGRFDRVIYISLPDFEDRKKVIQLYLDNYHSENIDIDELAKITDGFSQADIHHIFKRSSSILRQQAKELKSTGIVKLTMDHFRQTIQITNPSVSKSDRKKYEKLAEKFK